MSVAAPLNPVRTSAGILGFGLLALGSLSLLCMSVGASGSAWNSPTIYTKPQFLFGGALALLGLLPLTLSRVLAATAGCGAVVGAQLMGAGAVAFKHWLPASGQDSFAFSNYTLVRWLAIVLAFCGLAAAAGCLRTLHRRAAFDVDELPSAARNVVVGIGATVMIAMPFLLGLGDDSTLDVTSLGATFLLYALPLGGGLIIVGFLRRTPAMAALGTVAVSAVLGLVGKHMVTVTNPEVGFVLVLAAACAVLVIRWAEVDGRSAWRR